MKRVLSGVVAVALLANALAMLLAGPWWYGAVPGVTATGPFNPHFVKDIGAAYLVAGAGLAWRAIAAGAAGAGAAAMAAAFLVLHALIHLTDAAAGGHAASDLARDFAGVFLPTLIAVWIAIPDRKQP